MIRVTSQRKESVTELHTGGYHYKIAGQRLVFPSRVRTLEAFEQGPASESFRELLLKPVDYEVLTQASAELRYFGNAPFDNKMQEVRYWRKTGIAQIDVAGKPVCQIHLRERQIHLLSHRSFDDPLNIEVLTGPALVVLLASRLVYCMHAGAVNTQAGNLALIAESGTGKSTLSATAKGPDKPASWRQITDDILPLNWGESVTLLSDFPQLKLANGVGDYRAANEQPLDFILRLNPKPSKQIQFRRLQRTEALLQIVRHTVAAKLFDHDIMRGHAKFAKRLSRDAPMFELSYPRDLGALAELREAIVDHLIKEKNSATVT